MASGSRSAWPSTPVAPSSPRPHVPSSPGPSHARPFPSSSRPVPVKQPPQLTQPTPVKLSSSSIRNLPFRLTHPPEIPPELVHSSVPPSQTLSARDKGKGKAHWWSWNPADFGLRIQPQYEVSLEDVLDRKHLPPLGLKDFEEWLLYVDHMPENLYFILWLREYTARYDRWTSSLKSAAKKKHAKHKTRRSRELAFNTHPPPPTPLQPPQPEPPSLLQPPSGFHFPSARQRPLPSLGVAISSLSASSPPPPLATRSLPSSPTVVSSPTSPATLFSNESSESLEQHNADRRYRPYAPSPPPLPPNSSLALFYLRAKETFFVPGAPYELDVGSEVLGAFFAGDDEKGQDKGDGRNSTDPYDALRNLSTGDLKNMMKGTKGTGGKLPPPPAPHVFDDLKDIIEDRLRDSLARLVIATYNNVGMSRAYCGNAGGTVIGILLSGPPLAACFATHAARWWRLCALPGMWIGLTIFISALYGVCMMIYMFGDLRQLRSFELARPAISKPKPLKGDPLRGHRDSLKNATNDKCPRIVSNPPSPTAVTFTNPFPTAGASEVYSLSPSQASLSPASATSLSVPDPGSPSTKPVPRKMSLPTGLFFGSRVRAEEEETERERFERMMREATTPLTQPPLMPPLARVRSASVNDAAPSPLDLGVRLSPSPLTAPGKMHFDQGKRRSLDGVALELAGGRRSQETEENLSDDGYSSGSYDSSNSESESDEDIDRLQLSRRRRRRPVIEVSDAFYDENPAPEGPATAPADWFPASLERAARMNPIRDCPGPAPQQTSNFTTSNTSSHLTSSRGSAATNKKKNAPAPGGDPMWPDYEAGKENHNPWAMWASRAADRAEEPRREARAEQDPKPEPKRESLPNTAMFIQPFDYDGAQPWMGQDDLEKGARARADAPPGAVAFDFDGLPPRTTFSVSLQSSARAQGAKRTKGAAPARAASPAPSRSDLGSAIDVARHGWLVRTLCAALERLQRRCSPENVVEVFRRRSVEGERGADGGAPDEKAPPTRMGEKPRVVDEDGGRGRERRRRRVYLSVPAFAAPLTPVLNPLVGRAQWEIVVRSAALAAVISVVVVGGLLGVPE